MLLDDHETCLAREAASRGVITVRVADRLTALGLTLPAVPTPVANFVPARSYGNILFASGQTPTVDGVLTMRGKLGAEISVEQGQEGARLSVLNCLAAVAAHLDGDLDRVEAVLKLTGYVASAPGFVDQPTVINGASVLLEEVLGDAGRHARAAIGLAELPGGAPVEVDLVLAVRCPPPSPARATTARCCRTFPWSWPAPTRSRGSWPPRSRWCASPGSKPTSPRCSGGAPT